MKFYYLSQESAVKTLRRFWAEKKTKKRSDRMTIDFEGLVVTGSCVVLLMNSLRKKSTSEVPVLVYSGRKVTRNTGIPKTSMFNILDGVLQFDP